MNKRTKNILIIVLLLLVNVVGFYLANSYFNPSGCNNCETAKNAFSSWLGTKATFEQTARWIDSLANLLKIFKAA
jgi:hypothetical protein